MTRPLLRNAAMSVLEAICAAVTLFLVFRIVIIELGVEAVGAWSLVVATLSFATVADIGLGGALQRFVPAAIARGQESDAVSYIETSLVTVGVLYLVLLTLGSPLLAFVLSSSVSGTNKSVVLELLPYALVSFWLANVATVFLSGLAGVQRYDLRSAISIGGMAVQLSTAIVLLPRLGLVGLAWAQILQNLLLVVCGYFVLRRRLPGLPWLPMGFSRSHFRQMLRYGISLQLFLIANFLFEPTTKLILSNMAGLTWVGYYELTTRMARQVRNLIVSAAQVIVPAVAHINERDRAEALSIYRSATDLTWLLGWPVMGALAALTPSISEIWLGHADSIFIEFSLLLIGAWTINLLSSPGYFLALATGRLRWNLFGWILISSANLVLGLILGRVLGGSGVVLAAAISLGLGSALTLLGNHIQFGGNVLQFLSRSRVTVATLSSLAAAISISVFPSARIVFGLPVATLFCFAIISAAVIISFASDPLAAKILRSVRNGIAQRYRKSV